MIAAPRIRIAATKADPFGRRTFVVTADGDEIHRDQFNPDDHSRAERFLRDYSAKLPQSSRVFDPTRDGAWNPNQSVDENERLHIGERLREAATEADAETAITASRRILERLTSREMDEGDFAIRYMISDVLPFGEGGIIAAKSKSAKTHTAVDLAMSVATGTPFLGHFPSLHVGRTCVFSAESGKGALQEMGRRIANSKGFNLADVENLFWSTSVPRMPGDVRLLDKFITDEGLSLAVLDPTYFVLRDVGDNLANATMVGAALEPLSEIAHRTGCSIVLVSHNRKGRGIDQKRYDAPTLEEVAGAGIDQWARFWLLLGPRKEWDGDVGQHWLWLRTGGSAGHGNLFAVDVFEGKHQDEGGRVWEPTVTTASDERKRREAERERDASERQERTQSDNVCKLRIALKKFTDGETERVVRLAAKLNPPSFEAALADLRGRGEVADCKVQKGARVYDGIKWRDYWNDDEAPEQVELSGTQ